MPSYSSAEFQRDWRYAIEKDFIDAEGSPFHYAKDGKQNWGDELALLDFGSRPTSAAISSDCRYFAVAVERVIHVFDRTFKPLSILRGHSSKVDCLAFRPGAPSILVSSERNFRPDPSKIIFWDLENFRDRIPDENEIEDIGEDAANLVAERLADFSYSFKLNLDDIESLKKAIKPSVSEVLASKNVSGNLQLNGWLQEHFQSNIFSPSGKYMMYFPGVAAPSNGDAQWDIRVYSTEKSEDVLTLTGHRDAIMWMGYNYTESLIGTVAWDKTMRIWNATTGENKYIFRTEGQNWTGAFSPNCTLFAGTCGMGKTHVYSLEDGSELFQIGSKTSGWCRNIAWTPDSRKLAIGSQGFGELELVDIERQEVEQERRLSTEKMKLEDESMRPRLGHFLEVYGVVFVDGGRKLVHFASEDGSAEVYDLKTGEKWRFARAGTESYGAEASAEASETIQGGYKMVVWEDMEYSKLMIATVDGQAVRIWTVPLSEV